MESLGSAEIMRLSSSEAHHSFHKAARTIQHKWYKSKHKDRLEVFEVRLHRRNLIDRLTLEHRIIVGAARMFIQLATFTFIVLGLLLVGETETRRGLYSTLRNAFDLEDVGAISSKEGFTELMQTISVKSKAFLPLSSQYFQAEDGTSEILGPSYSFLSPMEFPKLKLKSTNFSFTAWVNYDVGKGDKKNLIKKRAWVGSTEIICFGFSIQSDGPFYGAQMEFGGNDYYDIIHEDQTSAGFWRVRPPMSSSYKSWAENKGSPVFVSFVVTEAKVQFWLQGNLMGARALARPITDCETDEGTNP